MPKPRGLQEVERRPSVVGRGFHDYSGNAQASPVVRQRFDDQQRFVSDASHELRTPLAINRTLIEAALRNCAAARRTTSAYGCDSLPGRP